jgi:hypothetical protein
MKAIKITVPFYGINVGRIMYMVGNQTLVIATPTEPQMFILNIVYNNAIKEKKGEEIDLLEERWLHPHLYKPIKNEVKLKTNGTA